MTEHKFTNTNHGVTMQDRHFTAGDSAIEDNNFDYDAMLTISGDFADGDKAKYASMIADVLNSHNKFQQQNAQLLEALKKLEEWAHLWTDSNNGMLVAIRKLILDIEGK